MADEGDGRRMTDRFGLGEGGAWLRHVAEASAGAPGQGREGRLGRYEILGEAGRGGQGTVYKARQPVTGRTVAIKRIGALAGTQAAARFQRELEAATRLSHPNVVTTYGAESIDGVLVTVMEFVDGQPIDRWAAGVRAGPGPPDWRRIVRACAGVCAGVAHAHQRGVIHRDIKPSNVLVDGGDRPRVLDFGVARVLDAERPATLTGFAGTPHFASPEQVTGNPTDARTDVYSLGVLLYELLAGRSPFEGARGLGALIDAVRAGFDPRVSGLCRGVPRDVDWIVARAAAVQPKGRYASVDALSRDLGAVLAGHAVEAHPPSAVYAWRKTLRRHRVTAASVAAVGLTLAGTSVFLWRAAAREREALAQTREALKRQEQARDLAQREVENQAQVATLLRTILNNANPATTRGSPGITMRDAVDRAAVSALKQQGVLSPEVEGTLRVALGEIYWGLGEMPAAREHFEVAASLFTDAHGAGHRRTLEALLFLSRIVRDSGDYRAALEVQDRIVAARRLGDTPDDQRLLAQALASLALTQRRLGLLNEAESSCLESIGHYERTLSPTNDNVAIVLGTLAGVYVDMGRLAEAEHAAERAMRLLDAVHPDGVHRDSAIHRRIYASVFMAEDDFARAEALLRASEEAWARLKDNASSTGVARTELELGRLLLTTGRPQEAVERLRDAHARFEAAFGQGTPDAAEARDLLERALSAPDARGSAIAPGDHVPGTSH